MKLRGWFVGAGLLLSICVPAARGQYARVLEDLISRPSARGPSANIGGRYTSQRYSPLSSIRSDVALLGRQQYSSRARHRARGRYTQSMSAPELGLRSGLGRPGNVSFYGGRTAMDIRSLSGFRSPYGLNLPVPGVPIRYVPSATASLYTPRPETTRFQDMFRLAPPPSEREGPMLPLPAERLNAWTAKRAVRARWDGIALFKEGTRVPPDPGTGRYEGCPDCRDKLRRAVQRLRLVRSLDDETAIPLMLLAHAALEREQPTLAMYYLVRAFQRQPDLVFARTFVILSEDATEEQTDAVVAKVEELTQEKTQPGNEQGSFVVGIGSSLDPQDSAVLSAMPGVEAVRAFDEFFGDSEKPGQNSVFLEAQLYRYQGIASRDAWSPEATAVEAYCRWRLGEYGPTRDALDQLDEMAATGEEKPSPALLSFSMALRMELPSP